MQKEPKTRVLSLYVYFFTFTKAFEDCIFFNARTIFIEKNYLECASNGLSDSDNIIAFWLPSLPTLTYDNHKPPKNANQYCLFCSYVI